MSGRLITKEATFTVDKKLFSVKTPSYYLDFSKCSVKHYPVNRADFTAIIDTLAIFHDSELISSKAKHKLSEKDMGTESDRISNFINSYRKVYSLDVFHRGSVKGKYRLLYTIDYDNPYLVHILDCFIDTH